MAAETGLFEREHVVYRGAVRKYYPDFIIHLQSDNFLVLEAKEQLSEQDRAKRHALEQWGQAVNECGGFDRRSCGVAASPGAVKEILVKYDQAATGQFCALRSHLGRNAPPGAEARSLSLCVSACILWTVGPSMCTS